MVSLYGKMAKIKKGELKAKNIRRELLNEMLRLSTNGFGLVAALAWNELIKETVKTYIQPFAGKSSGIISLFIYAVIVTILAVGVTYNLTKFVKKD